ncbi:MAG: anti-sigma factor, partial [Gammaproteobacteria bacterium]|nr:anti-sigma factor [Gammaproteobacteria bacterium]
MNQTPDHISEEELNAFLDGELSHARRDAAAAVIANDPELARRVSEYRRINERLQRRYDVVLSAPVPARILQPLTRHRFSTLRIAAVAAWLTLGGIVGAFVSDTVSTSQALRPLPVEAAFAHTIYVR